MFLSLSLSQHSHFCPRLVLIFFMSADVVASLSSNRSCAHCWTGLALFKVRWQCFCAQEVTANRSTSHASTFLRLLQIFAFPPSFELQSKCCINCVTLLLVECSWAPLTRLKAPGRINQSVRNCAFAWLLCLAQDASNLRLAQSTTQEELNKT